jgi:hypothetical protein
MIHKTGQLKYIVIIILKNLVYKCSNYNQRPIGTTRFPSIFNQ